MYPIKWSGTNLRQRFTAALYRIHYGRDLFGSFLLNTRAAAQRDARGRTMNQRMFLSNLYPKAEPEGR